MAKQNKPKYIIINPNTKEDTAKMIEEIIIEFISNNYKQITNNK